MSKTIDKPLRDRMASPFNNTHMSLARESRHDSLEEGLQVYRSTRIARSRSATETGAAVGVRCRRIFMEDTWRLSDRPWSSPRQATVAIVESQGHTLGFEDSVQEAARRPEANNTNVTAPAWRPTAL